MIQKEQPLALRLEFTVNPCQMLHQWLAPSIPFDAFLQKYAALTDEAFQKELTKAVKKFESDSFVMQPSGAKNALKLTEVPAAADLKKMLQQNLIILELPGNLQARRKPPHGMPQFGCGSYHAPARTLPRGARQLPWTSWSGSWASETTVQLGRAL